MLADVAKVLRRREQRDFGFALVKGIKQRVESSSVLLAVDSWNCFSMIRLISMRRDCFFSLSLFIGSFEHLLRFEGECRKRKSLLGLVCAEYE